MKRTITKSLIDKAEPRENSYIVWDKSITGFGVRIHPSGSKSYLLYYRTHSGQQRKPTIGKHGDITAEEARRIAHRWMAGVALGEDISGMRDEARKAPTVKDLCERYMEEYAKVYKKPRSYHTDERLIENHVLPLLGNLKVWDVKKKDVECAKFAVMNGKTARELPAKNRGRRIIVGGKGTANRVVALLSKMFNCAETWGLCDRNPAQGIKKYPEQRKDRFLNLDEVGRLLKALEQAEANASESPYAIATIRLLLFTGLRSGEVRNLNWGDVDLERKCFHLRDTKTGKRTVPLNDEAFEVIHSLPHLDDDERVIQSSKKDSLLSIARPWYRIREAANIDKSANLHCLRHTFASWAVMGGLSLAQTGALLGHKSAQTTLRYADHLTEAVRDYSQQTARFLTNGVNKGSEQKGGVF